MFKIFIEKTMRVLHFKKFTKKICNESNITIICNLHQVELAIKFSDRIIGLLDGSIMFDSPTKIIDTEYVKNIYREDNKGLTF